MKELMYKLAIRSIELVNEKFEKAKETGEIDVFGETFRRERTCHLVRTALCEDITVDRCSECGRSFGVWNYMQHKYCPSCGARVVENG